MLALQEAWIQGSKKTGEAGNIMEWKNIVNMIVMNWNFDVIEIICWGRCGRYSGRIENEAGALLEGSATEGLQSGLVIQFRNNLVSPWASLVFRYGRFGWSILLSPLLDIQLWCTAVESLVYSPFSAPSFSSSWQAIPSRTRNRTPCLPTSLLFEICILLPTHFFAVCTSVLYFSL